MAASSADDGVPVLVNGEVSLETDPTVVAQFSGQTITPTADFAFPWNGALVQFRSGDTSVVPADFLAALNSAGAPFTQP